MTQAPQPSVTLDLDMVRFWLDYLHGDSEGLLHVSSNLDWAGKAGTSAYLVSYIKQLHERGAEGIYLRACTLSGPPRGGGRGSEHDSLSFPGFWADIDIAGPGHKTKNRLPADIAEAQSLVAEAGLPEPTLWIHSGGGLYPWWILHKPIALSDLSRPRIREMATNLDDSLAFAAAKKNLHFGTGINDLARVLRIPGTINRKVPEAPTQCVILEQSGRMYEAQELEDIFRACASRIVRTAPESATTKATREVPADTPGGLSPFDDFEMRTDWADILEPKGWTFSHFQGNTRYWVRPGKTRREGHSASTGRSSDRDRLYVFSTETEFKSGESYNKGAAYAVLNHRGNMSEAARELKRFGYGTSHKVSSGSSGNGGSQGSASESTFPETPPEKDEKYPLSDRGNAQRLQKLAGHKFRWVSIEKLWYVFDGKRWIPDRTGALEREVYKVSDAILQEGYDLWRDDADETSKKRAARLIQFGTKLGDQARVVGAMNALKAMPGMSAGPEIFNRDTALLNLANGTLNLTDNTFTKHEAKNMLTKQFNAEYDAEATCPRFDQFLQEAIPDEATRDYLQRAMGYSLLGEADQRAIFLLHGKSGTGKSQLTRTMQLLFGDYGASAAASTFRVRRGESITNDIHDLRGTRFVSTSESSADTALDEELVKRLTGNDIITSRGLYQEFQSWRPHCVIWMATNHLPKLNSDDDAIWKRVKPIPMNTVFAGRDDEVGAFAERVLIAEASGILNWLLEGVRKYRENGLRDEPELLKQTVAEYKIESDNVALFINESLEEELLVEDPEASLTSRELYHLYSEFCQRMAMRPLGIHRFKNRMERLGYEYYRSNGSKWRGLRKTMLYGATGTMN